jgi:predicted TIM-barrel fold metal-dependent hydrolase
MKVIDPHIHLWDTQSVEYPWLNNPAVAFSGDNRLLPQRYDVAAFLEDTEGIEVLATVDVEANPLDPVAEAAWLQSAAENPESRGHPHGIVCYVDLSEAEAPRLFDRLSRYPNVRGIRQILNTHMDARFRYVNRNYMTERRWRENLARLAQFDWSFDLQFYPRQCTEASEVVGANPDTVFVINHTGMYVDRDSAQGWEEWRRSLRVLASYSNTAIKISGLAMFDHHWTTASFRPLVFEALECFGADRCMFASNFPIDRLHSNYSTLWHAYADITSGLSAGERDNLFVHNAARCYRLRVPA